MNVKSPYPGHFGRQPHPGRKITAAAATSRPLFENRKTKSAFEK
jgi:hypothetical protein